MNLEIGFYRLWVLATILWSCAVTWLVGPRIIFTDHGVLIAAVILAGGPSAGVFILGKLVGWVWKGFQQRPPRF